VEHGLAHWQREATLAEAVRASTSIPIVFEPKEVEDATLVDGGLLENLPASALRLLGTTRVLGVSLLVAGEKSSVPRNVLGVARAMIGTMEKQTLRQQKYAADYILEVVLPEGSGVFTFEQMESFVEIGYAAAKKAVPEIKRMLMRPTAAITMARSRG
jgi:NTE family protein